MSKIKKGVLLGLGVLDITKDKTDKLIKEVAKQHGVSVKEGRKLVESVITKNKKQGKAIVNEIESRLYQIANKAISVGKEELDILETRLNKKSKLNQKRGAKMTCGCCKPKAKKKAKKKK